MRNKAKRVSRAKKNFKADLSKVIFSYESCARLDGPHGWIIDDTKVPVRLKRQQGGGRVTFWAGIVGDSLMGPFRVPDGVKMETAFPGIALRPGHLSRNPCPCMTMLLPTRQDRSSMRVHVLFGTFM